MKSLLIALSAVAILFASCSKNPEKALPRKDGKWSFTGTVKFVDTDPSNQVSLLFPVTGEMTFDKNGTFTSVTTDLDGSQSTEAGTWSATKTTVSTTNFLDDVVVFNVSDLKRKSETWDYSQVDGTSTTTLNLKLTR